MPARRISISFFISIALAVAVFAQFHRKSNAGPTRAPFDYYVLSLSWAPAFCAEPGEATRNPKECASGVAFVVHGLWPQNESGRSPEFCGDAKPVPKAVIQYVLPTMLSPALIQHEWAAHGVCTGLTPFDYFSAIVQARSEVQLPVQLTSIESPTKESAGQIETDFAKANPSFPPDSFRTHCPRGVFQEERVCFANDLKPRACASSAGECKDPAVLIRPPV